MKSIIILIDSICDAYDNHSFIPTNGITHCNEAVQAIVKAMGYIGLDGKNADEIMNFISTSDIWSPVPTDKAQDMANEGSLLVAGLTSKELNQDHGHVVVIRPGVPCYSGKWGSVPRILNIGKTNFIARSPTGPLTGMPVGINEAFVPIPRIYVWRDSL